MTYFWIALVALIVAFFRVIASVRCVSRPRRLPRGNQRGIDEKASISHFAE
jgi:hypothetical protein